MSIEEDVRRFEGELQAIADRALACAGLLRSVESDDLRYLIAERLPFLGRLVLPEMLSLLEDDQVAADTRYLAAWVALRVGDRGVAPKVLCDEVASGSEWSGPAASALGRAGITEATEVIADALRWRVDPRDEMEVISYTGALLRLGGSLPDDVRARLYESAAPHVVRALTRDFPE